MTYQLILLKLQFQLCVEKVRCLMPKYGLYEGYDTSQIPQNHSLTLKPIIKHYLPLSLLKLPT